MTHRELLEEAMKALEPFGQKASMEKSYDMLVGVAHKYQFELRSMRQARTTYDKIKAALEPDKDKP